MGTPDLTHTAEALPGTFPSWGSRCAVTQDFPALSLGVGQTQFGDVSSALSISLFF